MCKLLMADSVNSLLSSTVLIVDDTPNNLQLLFQYLKNTGYRILSAYSGRTALETVKTIRPDLILLDVMMSEVDGFTTCRYLKNNAATKDIPIIFMTALTETVNKVRGFELGAVDYITKPIEKQELLARIRTHLSLQDLNRRLAKEADRQKLLFEISDRIRQTLDLKLILQTATTEIRSFLNCDLVWLACKENDNISVKAISTSDDFKLQLPENLPKEYLYLNSTEYQFYLQGNIRIIEDNNECATIEQLCSCSSQARLIAPILINSNSSANSTTKDNLLWGWLIAHQCMSHKPWLSEEIDLFKKVTTQLAIAIKQALLYQQIAELALLDSLTNVYNRRYFDRQLNLEWRRLQRLSAPLSLILCDVDYFKIYNDTYGHQQGDLCLQQVAKAISTVTKRPADLVARYGGEEFVVILPHTPKFGAVKVAKEIGLAVKALNIPHLNSSVDSVVTISIGVAYTVPNKQNNPKLLVEAADRALYQAKERGRDCLAVYPHPISLCKQEKSLNC